MRLQDDDPLWDQHSGRSGHRGREWGPGDSLRVAKFYESLSGNARIIYDLLMDHPGEQFDSEHIFAQLPKQQTAGAQSRMQRSRAVSGSLSVTRRLATAADRRFPFYWWKGKDDAATLYAMKPVVAQLFRDARQQAQSRLGNVAAGTDWTAAEVAATVDDYLAMLTAEAADQDYSKTEHRRALKSRLSASRTDGAIERSSSSTMSAPG